MTKPPRVANQYREPAGDLYDSSSQSRQDVRDIARLWAAVTIQAEELDKLRTRVAELESRMGYRQDGP